MENPMMFSALSFITALMSGDIATIETNFALELTQKPNTDAWEIVLTPKNSPFDAIFASINVAGDDRLMRAIQLNEIRGDVTRIVFDDLLLNAADISQQWPEASRVWCQ
jgi:hypothetical protein